jgi:lipopolysaccharide/colanic/teichoic acid biosynthesis glycosyltransferase
MSTVSLPSKQLLLLGSAGSQRADRLRIVERCAGALAFACCAPVVAGAAIAVRALSGRSPFIAHKRVGLHGAEFWMLKLRTMWDDDRRPENSALLVERVDSPEVPELKDGCDLRVTSPFAATLRKFSIDELPQLLHVASGRMSFVGPRPITLPEMEAYYGEAAATVLQLRPGITGLWQIMGRNRLTYAQRKRLDLMLVKRWSAGLCIAILLRTPARVISGRDAY